MKQTMKIAALALSLLISATSFAGQMGQAIPKDAPSVKLAEILKTPAKYKGKEVVLQGNYGSMCCATDFNYKEGLDGIEISATEFDDWKKLKKGTPVKVYGKINVIERAGGENIVGMNAKGMETK
ncbi:MAG: hypothetical protein AB7G93_13075 [Bdellovibrionales bacterium]